MFQEARLCGIKLENTNKIYFSLCLFTANQWKEKVRRDLNDQLTSKMTEWFKRKQSACCMNLLYSMNPSFFIKLLVLLLLYKHGKRFASKLFWGVSSKLGSFSIAELNCSPPKLLSQQRATAAKKPTQF